jgi:signal transduction histidine kinase
MALIAGSLTLFLEAAFPPLEFQGALLAVVMVLVALNWGEGPSLLVVFIGALLLAVVALPPHFAWEIDDRSEVVGFFVFVVTGVLINLIASQAGRARRTSEHLAHEAEAARQHAEELADLLRQAHQHSEQERRSLQQVLDVLPVGVTLVDPQGLLLQMNRAMRALWEREVPPLGEPIRTLAKGWWPLPADSAPAQEGPLTQALTLGATAPGQEVEMETVAGHRKTLLHLAAPLLAEDGAVLGGVVAEIDLTERKRLEEHLRAAKAQMDAFLAIASHELKTPLTTLKLQTQATGRRLHRLTSSEAPAEWAEQLATAQGSVDLTNQQIRRMELLVNDLVEVSRIEAGKLDLYLEPVDLAGLIRQVVKAQQASSARETHMHLEARQPGPVMADAGRLEQVLTNYLTNALKYSPEEAPVEVGLEVEAQQVRVWVRDAGPGIPIAEQERIWERFHRVPGIEVQSGSGIGLGLGLSISREMIERHHGQVGVQSTPGAGSTFWFTLPRARTT